LSPQVQTAITAWVRLAGAHASMTRAFNADLQAAGAITVTDFEALRRLAAAPGGRMRRVDLAQAVGLTASGITRLLDGLQGCGLVRKEQCTADARVTYAVITDTGHEVLTRTAQTHLDGLAALFSERFSPEEVDHLVVLLGRLPGAQDDASSCPGITATSEPRPPAS
jgi:DNA-binding MarR family transcriptional regulator